MITRATAVTRLSFSDHFKEFQALWSYNIERVICDVPLVLTFKYIFVIKILIVSTKPIIFVIKILIVLLLFRWVGLQEPAAHQLPQTLSEQHETAAKFDQEQTQTSEKRTLNLVDSQEYLITERAVSYRR